jgi:aspartate aminotransferase
LKELAQVARKYSVILVSDEIYGKLHHNNQHVSIARYYPEGTIISSGLSKWCGAGGWRLGTFSFPEELTWLQKALAVAASETFTSTSAPIQFAAVKAFEGGEDIENYLVNSRKILKTLARFCTNQLHAMHVDMQQPNGAFYLFPDFENHKEKLASKGIHTSYDLCTKILNETGVAMLPGSDFGCNPHDLSCRIAYVDFDGKAALNHLDQSDEISKTFIQEYSPNIGTAFERLGNWFADL